MGDILSIFDSPTMDLEKLENKTKLYFIIIAYIKEENIISESKMVDLFHIIHKLDKSYN